MTLIRKAKEPINQEENNITMKNILNKISIALAAAAMILTVSCSKVNPADNTEKLLEVNASNLQGNWQLVAINGETLAEGATFYINFSRSGQEFKIWDSMTSIPSSYNYSEGTFALYTDPELGTYIRGIDSVKEEWSDLYVVKELTKNSMVWVGVNNPTFTQTFNRVSSIPFEK